MSKTSSTAKQRYNEKAYDFVNLALKKGQKDTLREAAAAHDMSLNAFIVSAAIRMAAEIGILTPDAKEFERHVV